MADYVLAPEIARMPNEPQRWFDWLVRYVLLPPERRSALRVYRVEVEQARTGRKRPDDVPGAWKAAIVRWCWKERAEQYDQEMHRRRMVEEAEARAKMNQRHIQMAQAVHGKVLQRLKDLKLERLADVILAWKVAVEIERAAMETPAELARVASLSDAELVRRYGALLGRLTGEAWAGGSPLVE